MECPLGNGNRMHGHKVSVFGVDDDLRTASGDAVHRDGGTGGRSSGFGWIG